MDILENFDFTGSEMVEVQTFTERSISETNEKCLKRLHLLTRSAKRRAQTTETKTFRKSMGRCMADYVVTLSITQGSIECHKESKGIKRTS